MDRNTSFIRVDQPTHYIIKVQGRLERDLSDWFIEGGWRTYHSRRQSGQDVQTVITAITGKILDQAALYGLLNHIRDLGLVLLYLECLDAVPRPEENVSQASS